MTIPKYLYHYTSIENLALILGNRTLRFSRTDLVNDLEEINITDLPEIKKAVYISCWTASEKESIPLWNLYASKAKGVRIKLPSNMFLRSMEPYKVDNIDCYIVNLMSLHNIVECENDNQWIPYLFGPVQISYDADNAVAVLNEDKLEAHKIGTVKLDHWAFEKEHRFLIIPDALWNPEKEHFILDRNYISNPKINVFIDISLDPKVLDSIEVTLGPSATEAEKCIVTSLLETFAKKGTVVESKLKDRIRL